MTPPDPGAPFCVECGAREPLPGEALCQACYLASRTWATLPETLRVEVCAHCGARHRPGSWGDPLPDLGTAILEEARGAVEPDPGVRGWTLRLDGGERDPSTYTYEAVIEGRAGPAEVPFAVRRPLLVHVQRSTCTRCGRRAGGYYEAILQLRGHGKAIGGAERDQAAAVIDRVLGDLHAQGDLDAFLVKAEDVKGGWDFYLGTVQSGRAIARALAHDLGAAIRETASLVGRKDGADMYRVTFSARLPRARPGGFVALDGALYLVTSLGPKTAALVRLDDHRRVTRERADFEEAEALEPGAAQDAVVVSESAGELQLLDPRTLRTVDVVKPPGFPPGLASARVVAWGERLWLLPARGADKLT